ncbi:hypothetical protein C1H76_1293 [Elsinoe australis]|uniref:Rhodopsin domain-containing protein n=1 Tax=Elsinoe australis TaxID=40998 RepID=A0A4U7B943_9PEZI|nr:hypothetical protein C1H76_1293 [Elsinoe australis]
MEDRAAGFLATCIICLFVTWIAVPLRCYARRKVIARLAAEDWIMVAAQFFFTLEIIGCFFQIAYGMGNHNLNVDPHSMERAFFLLFIGTHLYATVMLLARVSIGLLLLRLMASRLQKITVWTMIVINVITWVVYVIWTFHICSPVQRYWQWSSPTGVCHVQRYAIGTYMHSAVSVLSDWTLSLIPMYVLCKSNLARKTRIATAGILSLGALASISTMIRLVEVKRANNQGVADFLYTIADVLTWSIAEQGLAIAAGCFATFRPLFVKIARQSEPSEGTRGRPGRPPQPGDTQVDWDPGLTIGFIGSTDEETGKFGQLVQAKVGVVTQHEMIQKADRDDSRAPLQPVEPVKKNRKSIIYTATKEGLI